VIDTTVGSPSYGHLRYAEWQGASGTTSVSDSLDAVFGITTDGDTVTHANPTIFSGGIYGLSTLMGLDTVDATVGQFDSLFWQGSSLTDYFDNYALDENLAFYLPKDEFADSLGIGVKVPAYNGNLDTLWNSGDWKLFYTDGAAALRPLALGGDGTYLKSNGASTAPSWAAPAGGGDMMAADVRDSTLAVLEDSLYVTGPGGPVTADALIAWSGTSGTKITGTGTTLATVQSSMIDSAKSSFKTESVLLFSTAGDTSVIATNDTLPLGWSARAFLIDSVVVSTFGAGAPNHTFQVYHSGSTATFSSAQTVNALGVSSFSTMNDNTGTAGRLYVTMPAVTTVPARYKFAVYLWGKWQ